MGAGKQHGCASTVCALVLLHCLAPQLKESDRYRCGAPFPSLLTFRLFLSKKKKRTLGF